MKARQGERSDTYLTHICRLPQNIEFSASIALFNTGRGKEVDSNLASGEDVKDGLQG